MIPPRDVRLLVSDDVPCGFRIGIRGRYIRGRNTPNMKGAEMRSHMRVPSAAATDSLTRRCMAMQLAAIYISMTATPTSHITDAAYVTICIGSALYSGCGESPAAKTGFTAESTSCSPVSSAGTAAAAISAGTGSADGSRLRALSTENGHTRRMPTSAHMTTNSARGALPNIRRTAATARTIHPAARLMFSIRKNSPVISFTSAVGVYHPPDALDFLFRQPLSVRERAEERGQRTVEVLVDILSALRGIKSVA